MNRRIVTLALVFSGFTALVYQVLWTRLLGFVFGTSSEAIGSVLAVFFAGMAIGNWWAARSLSRVKHPLRVYGWLELGIGVWALLSLPLLRELPALYGLLGGDPGPTLTAFARLAAAAVVLLPPTIAMGATLPVVARGVVGEDATLGRWSALLYAANTLGAVLGAYLCGFWLLPELGLTAAITSAAAVNLLVATAILLRLGHVPAAASLAAERAGQGSDIAIADRGRRAAFLAFFAVSGFVAIGYEIVWSKVFGIVMEGTVYGFSAVLSAYLTGIALGSAAAAPFVDRIRDLPRAFGLLHVGAGLAVAAGLLAVPYLPWAHARLAALDSGGDVVHLLFALVFPIVLAPTVLFGAAFPILIRIYTARAGAVGEGMGRAVSVNTAGSIVASLSIGFIAIPRIGMDATLYGLILLDLLLAATVLWRFQLVEGAQRLPAFGTAAATLALVGLGYNGVHAELAVAGREVKADTFQAYRQGLAEESAHQIFVSEGRNAIVTVTADANSLALRTNGLPEAGVHLGPPYNAVTTTLLGTIPYLVAERPERALVIGLGAGNTLETLLRTDLARVDVVELEEGVVRATDVLHAGRTNPLTDPRVRLHVNDGRNVLLRNHHGGGEGWDVIASQPSHPWLIGAANLFTEEFFELARAALRPGGTFALWVNGFRTDREAFLAVVASFERIFPGAVVADISANQGRDAFLLLGMQDAVAIDPERMRGRLESSKLLEQLAHHRVEGIADVLARFEASAADLALQAGGARNTDDNAYVETHIPRKLAWQGLQFEVLEAALPPGAPVLPPTTSAVDVVPILRGVLRATQAAPDPKPLRKLERILEAHGGSVDPFEATLLRGEALLMSNESAASGESVLAELAKAHPERPEPWRILALHRASRLRDFARAGEDYAAAHARSELAADAYDAARAFDYVNVQRAWQFVEAIPAAERAAYPRIAWYEAKQALRSGADGPALRSHFEALRRYRDTAEGRRIPGVNATLAALALGFGDLDLSRAFLEADRRERMLSGEPLLEAARQALARGELAEAERAIVGAARLLPGHTEVARLRAEHAAAAGDPQALATALAELRSWAPSLKAAVSSENRFRSARGLPLLPEQPAARFAR